MKIKPLYYTFQVGVFIFASEIKAILNHPVVSIDLDEVALYHYLTFRVAHPPNSLFENIRKLPAAHYMTIDENANCEIVNYWSPLCNAHSNKDRNEVEYYAEKVKELLIRSIESRIMSDVPFGAFLSGGIDLTTNVALMDRLMEHPVETFSVGFKNDTGYNEFEFARKCARKFQSNHHEVLIDETDMLEYLPQMVISQDEPIADPVCVPLFYLSKSARENGVIVLQVGEGTDELFCGYPGWMAILKLCRANERYCRVLPSWFRRPLYRGLQPCFTALDRTRELEFLRRASYD